ncbi:MAG: TatD family hydrolase [Deltaproteobacteria bacterium]|nr:TatD family hydrolase [Deltaproteobacteria bacterium]MBW2415789.1 TatD family hydrolase [Deltaproteobacteria bacterium]
MRLFDSHAHIGAPELLAEAPELLDCAREAGVIGVIAVGSGYGLGANGGAVALADAHRDVWATAGVHPHDAHEWGERAGTAVDGWLGHDRVVAVGECGLDYWYEHSPREAQAECLRGQIRLARRHGLPLVIHVRASRDTRDAFDDLIRIFDDEGADRAGGVIHCFTGDAPLAEACLERGFDISFSGILTFRNAADLREVARGLPLDRLLIETDSPLLAPVPHRGRRNQPAWVGHVAECLAEVRGLEPERVADSSAAAACRVFGITGVA